MRELKGLFLPFQVFSALDVDPYTSYFLTVWIVKLFSHVWLFATSRTIAYHAPHPWDLPGKSTGVGCHFLLQGIVPTQGLNLHLLQWQVDSLLSKSPQKPISLYTGYNEDLPPAPGGTLRLTQDDGQSFAKRVFCKNSIRSTSWPRNPSLASVPGVPSTALWQGLDSGQPLLHGCPGLRASVHPWRRLWGAAGVSDQLTQTAGQEVAPLLCHQGSPGPT